MRPNTSGANKGKQGRKLKRGKTHNQKQRGCLYNNPNKLKNYGYPAEEVEAAPNFKPDDKFLSNLRMLEASSLLSGVPISLELALNSMLMQQFQGGFDP